MFSQVQSPQNIVMMFLAFLISITVHEFAHAIVADRLGDPTPREHGRISLNPLVLMQDRNGLIGALVIPAIGSIFGFAIGWASTPVNLGRVRRSVSIRTANLLVSGAGPVSNFLLALASAFILSAVASAGPTGGWVEPVTSLLKTLVFLNVLLGLFNLLPIPPLDGFSVAQSALPRSQEGILRFLMEYQTVLFLVVLMTAGRLLVPPTISITRFFLSIAGF